MIFLITAQPGHGKSLWTIDRVKRRSEDEGRTVYYAGIDDLRLPWVPLQTMVEGAQVAGENWTKVPDGSIVVIDECQRVFRPRGMGSKVPDFVAALETHRHRGIDVYLVTQHPTLIDAHVRRLVDQHFHIKRRFGFKAAAVHQFFETREHPDRSRYGSVQSEWRYPVEAFSFYKSASLHTVRAKLPTRMYVALAAPLVIGGVAWFAWSSVSERYFSKKGELASAAPAAVPGSQVPGKGQPIVKDHATLQGEYIAAHRSLLPGLAFTAPVYAELIKPKSVPAPQACVASSSKCACYSEQATLLQDVPEDVCRRIVEHGFFMAWHDRQQGAALAAAPSASDGASARARAAPAGGPGAALQVLGSDSVSMRASEPATPPQVVRAPAQPAPKPPGGPQVPGLGGTPVGPSERR